MMTGINPATRARTNLPHLEDPYYQQALMDTAALCVDFAAQCAARRPPVYVDPFVRPRSRPGAIALPAPLGPADRSLSAAGVTLSQAALWSSVVRDLAVAGGARQEAGERGRGYTAVCRLTGLRWENARRFVADASLFSPEQCAEVWHAELSPPDQRVIGYVYAARTSSMPGRIKIGFTTDLSKRQRALSSQVFSPVWMIGARVGTLMHEWCLHQAIDRPADHEWHPEDCAPQWLIGREPPRAADARAA